MTEFWNFDITLLAGDFRPKCELRQGFRAPPVVSERRSVCVSRDVAARRIAISHGWPSGEGSTEAYEG